MQGEVHSRHNNKFFLVPLEQQVCEILNRKVVKTDKNNRFARFLNRKVVKINKIRDVLYVYYVSKMKYKKVRKVVKINKIGDVLYVYYISKMKYKKVMFVFNCWKYYPYLKEFSQSEG